MYSYEILYSLSSFEKLIFSAKMKAVTKIARIPIVTMKEVWKKMKRIQKEKVTKKS